MYSALIGLAYRVSVHSMLSSARVALGGRPHAMGIHFIFPADPLRPSDVDDLFADQRAVLRDAGFSTSLCPDAVVQTGAPLRNVPAGATIVYRGWMMDAAEYARLAAAVAAAGASLLTPPEAYLAAHHLPNWYPLIAEHTPETRVLPTTADFESELRAIGWDAFFVKDFVKSLKTARGSIVRDPSEITAVVREMEQFRGPLEGGLCVRRVEAFVASSERRYFVLLGKAYGAGGGQVPELVEGVAGRIGLPFFSVDVIAREDGVLRVVEVGDGQVSDLVRPPTSWKSGEWRIRPTTEPPFDAE
ncbi:MAG TPA: ATP-grasp domain-containing protein, partial [Gemmataceae bacterium]|nr:ATP-grasp domain-containing protein [Gemmataceae bacterium]